MADNGQPNFQISPRATNKRPQNLSVDVPKPRVGGKVIKVIDAAENSGRAQAKIYPPKKEYVMNDKAKDFLETQNHQILRSLNQRERKTDKLFSKFIERQRDKSPASLLKLGGQ